MVWLPWLWHRIVTIDQSSCIALFSFKGAHPHLWKSNIMASLKILITCSPLLLLAFSTIQQQYTQDFACTYSIAADFPLVLKHTDELIYITSDKPAAISITFHQHQDQRHLISSHP